MTNALPTNTDLDTTLEVMPGPTDEEKDLEKLKSLIAKIRICLMTTLGSDRAFHSRPMSFLEWSEEGTLLFFTKASSSTVEEIEWNTQVSLGFCQPSDNAYVCIVGEAEVVYDRELVQKLFSPMMKNWFPGGAEDPSLRLLSVIPKTAEYWDGPSGISLLISLAKARLTDSPQDLGEHRFFRL